MREVPAALAGPTPDRSASAVCSAPAEPAGPAATVGWAVTVGAAPPGWEPPVVPVVSVATVVQQVPAALAGRVVFSGLAAMRVHQALAVRVAQVVKVLKVATALPDRQVTRATQGSAVAPAVRVVMGVPRARVESTVTVVSVVTLETGVPVGMVALA
ncbi:hypothetical protein SKC42_22165 [Mycobacterium sp. 050134]